MTPNDPNFPSTPEVPYPNDPNDPTKPGQPVVPNVPGYKPYLPDPKDPSKPGQPVEPGKELPNLPTNPGDDTPIIYVPIVNDVTKPTKQTVTFEGAGDNTPAAKVQNDFTFTGKQKNGTTTWDQPNHTYGKETVPVVTGYYADKTEAGGKTVTPDAPNATDTVTYKAFGKFIAVDENGNPIPGVSTTAYTNDPNDATKMIAIDKTLPSIPGYTVKVIPASPSNPGEDTRVVYVAIVNDVTKATNKRLPSKVQATKIQLSTFKIALASTVSLTKWNKQALGIKKASLMML